MAVELCEVEQRVRICRSHASLAAKEKHTLGCLEVTKRSTMTRAIEPKNTQLIQYICSIENASQWRGGVNLPMMSAR